MEGATRAQLRKLQEPFAPEMVRWRIGPTNEKRRQGDEELKGLALAYIDARDVMRRLDAIVGPENWKDAYQPCEGGVVFCQLSVRLGDGLGGGEWITKADGSDATDIESTKGAISGSLKRAAVHWGVGRYLYEMDSPWVEIEKRGAGPQIKAKEQKRLREMLKSGKLKPASPQLADEQTLEQKLEAAFDWCAARDISRAMVFGLLEKDEADPLSEDDLVTIRTQARLVNSGELSPADAFGPSAAQRAAEVDRRINGEGA